MKIFLPGGEEQIKFLLNNFDVKDKKVLVVGAQSALIAKKLFENRASVELIVDDHDSLINSNLELDELEISAKMMEFDVTDYDKGTFDIIFSQGATSTFDRKNIVKELRRILKNDGIMCLGEIVKLEENVPYFIQNIFANSQLDPLQTDKITKFYEERRFKILHIKNLSNKLTEFYKEALKSLNQELPELSTSEVSYYKKLLNKISHESKVYLNQGGNKYIGFKSLIIQKQN